MTLNTATRQVANLIVTGTGTPYTANQSAIVYWGTASSTDIIVFNADY